MNNDTNDLAGKLRQSILGHHDYVSSYVVSVNGAEMRALLDERDRLLPIVAAAKALVAAIISPPDGCEVDWAGGLWWTREAEQRAQELVRVVNGPS